MASRRLTRFGGFFVKTKLHTQFGGEHRSKGTCDPALLPISMFFQASFRSHTARTVYLSDSRRSDVGMFYDAERAR